MITLKLIIAFCVIEFKISKCFNTLLYKYVIPMYVYVYYFTFFLSVAIFKMNYSHFVKYHGRFDKVVHLCIHESVVKMA